MMMSLSGFDAKSEHIKVSNRKKDFDDDRVPCLQANEWPDGLTRFDRTLMDKNIKRESLATDWIRVGPGALELSRQGSLAEPLSREPE